MLLKHAAGKVNPHEPFMLKGHPDDDSSRLAQQPLVKRSYVPEKLEVLRQTAEPLAVSQYPRPRRVTNSFPDPHVAEEAFANSTRTFNKKDHPHTKLSPRMFHTALSTSHVRSHILLRFSDHPRFSGFRYLSLALLQVPGNYFKQSGHCRSTARASTTMLPSACTISHLPCSSKAPKCLNQHAPPVKNDEALISFVSPQQTTA